MKAWRVMLGLSVLLVLYAVVVAVSGIDVSPIELGVVVLFGIIGIYLGERMGSRLG